VAINKTVAGTYEVNFRDQFKRRIRKTFDKHKDAVDFEKDSLAQVAKREYIRPSDETVKEIAEKWRQRKVDAKKPDGTPSYKRSSLEGWKNHVNRFIVADLGSLKVHELDVEAIEQAAAKWQERVSPKTVNKILTTLTAILDLAKRYKLIKENPAREAERLKLATADEDSDEVTPDQVYNKGELKKLIEAPEAGSRDRLFVMVPALLGLRIGEVLALTWPAIDLKAGKLQVVLNLADSDKGEEPLFQTPKDKEQPTDSLITARAYSRAQGLETPMS
jgi:integrase